MVVTDEELLEPHIVGFTAEVLDERGPTRAADSGLEVGDNDVLARAIEIHRAASGKKRETVGDLTKYGSAPGIEDCAQPILKSKLPPVLADEIDDGQVALARGAPQTPA